MEVEGCASERGTRQRYARRGRVSTVNHSIPSRPSLYYTLLYHIGTDEDFERVWEEAFPSSGKCAWKKLSAGIFTSNRAIMVSRVNGNLLRF